MLLDPNNFRFQDAPDFVFADTKRFAEETVQAKAAARLRDEGLLPLKQSILRNGFLPFERLVVTPYNATQFLVIEGNRRLAAMQWIRNDSKAGAAISKEIEETLKAVPVVIVPSDSSDPALREALMGVRHVSGIKGWGGYQRALLVATLKEKYSLESIDVAQRLGMTVQEVNRRYRALKALQQMMNNENFSDYAKPDMYPLFHEAVSLPLVREWLGWDEVACEFKNETTTDQFFSLITTSQDSADDSKPPKITTYAEVRDLRLILANPEARKVLLDPTKSFTEALAVTKREEIVRSWKAEVAEATEALKGIGVYELKRVTDEDLGLIKGLGAVIEEVISSIKSLRNP
jgi:hypothetical protein